MDKKPAAPGAVVNLVNLLVKQGVIKQDQAQALIKEAEDEAYISQQANQDATKKADQASKAATDAAAAANPPGTRHVTYVPEIVKQQLREEIKQEVMAKAEKENWASPGAYPEWASRIHFYGDFRTRYQGNFFPSGNDKLFNPNFQALNTGSPYLAFLQGNPDAWPTYDVGENRNLFALRARLGMEADLDAGFTAGLRLATGNDSSPVSTNQTLGGNGNGTSVGNFSKYQLWLDRAYLRNDQSFGPADFRFSIGRFDNPFWSPTDLVWYSDLAFDGVALQGKYAFSDIFAPFGTIGAFPIYNTALNAGINLPDPTGEPTDISSHDRYLFGGQFGFATKLDPEINARFAVGFYAFEHVQAELSDPCFVSSASDVCDSDTLRPAFAQKGNTYTPLRNIIVDPVSLIPDNNFQFYGLAAQFRPLNVSGQFDFSHFAPVHVMLDGDYVWNTAFNRSAIAAVAVNNFSASPGTAANPATLGTVPATSSSLFNGGSMGWMTRLTVGSPKIEHLGDWNVLAAYKYLQSDAVIDAFTDPDFGLGGTNLKGYIVGANYGLSDNVWLTVRWLSANNIGGAAYAVDVLQADLNAKF